MGPSFMRRKDAAERQRSMTGTGSPRTLAKLAVEGGGPPITYMGRIPLYETSAFDAWVMSKLSRPVGTSAERPARSATEQHAEAAE